MSKVFDYLTDRVTKMLETGVVPWRRPWQSRNGLTAMNISGKPYRGINWFLMNMLAHETPIYLTMNQIKKMGGTIKEEDKKAYYPVYFYSFVEKEDATGKKSRFPIFRYYNVWNIESVEGVKIPKKIADQIAKYKAEGFKHDPIQSAEAVIKGMPNPPKMSKSDDRAYYMPAIDTMRWPDLSQFENPVEYYLTAFHEMGHSTGHSTRLNRSEVMDPIKFGSHAYSREELVAEMTAAMLAEHCGIVNDGKDIENSAAYIAGWAAKIKADPRMLMTAASHAQKAVDYILGTTFDGNEED